MIEFESSKKIENILIRNLPSNFKIEHFFFMFAILFVVSSSVYKHDSIIALVSALCGMIYTIFAGKGKVYCYFFGIIGTLCCAYLSYKIALYGNFVLHLAYYFPMEIVGFFTWKRHLNKATSEIIKEKLTNNERVLMVALVVLSTVLMYLVFIQICDKSPLMDAAITVLSVAGMVLTVKRTIEQWIVWTLVNFFSIIMWFDAYMAGQKIFSIFVVRIIYFILGIYFFIKWAKSSDEENN